MARGPRNPACLGALKGRPGGTNDREEALPVPDRRDRRGGGRGHRLPIPRGTRGVRGTAADGAKGSRRAEPTGPLAARTRTSQCPARRPSAERYRHPGRRLGLQRHLADQWWCGGRAPRHAEHRCHRRQRRGIHQRLCRERRVFAVPGRLDDGALFDTIRLRVHANLPDRRQAVRLDSRAQSPDS